MKHIYYFVAIRTYVRTQFIKNDNPRHLHECDTNFVIEGN